MEHIQRTLLPTTKDGVPHGSKHLSKSVLELLVSSTESDPLNGTCSAHVASPHDLVDEPSCLAVRIQRPSLTTGTSACRSANAMNVSGQSAWYVVLQDVGDTSAG